MGMDKEEHYVPQVMRSDDVRTVQTLHAPSLEPVTNRDPSADQLPQH